jgi:hypothetical protein
VPTYAVVAAVGSFAVVPTGLGCSFLRKKEVFSKYFVAVQHKWISLTFEFDSVKLVCNAEVS